MNALLLTVLGLAGADASAVYGGPSVGSGVAPQGMGQMAGGMGGYCDDCNDGGGGRHHHHGDGYGGIGGWCGPMPQSCYNPSFGCYPSTRFMHRYPAFHNYYYRSAYNYRHYFDYPWHAGLHEPTSMFSYHVPGENQGQTLPTPVPAASMNSPTPARTAAMPGSVLR